MRTAVKVLRRTKTGVDRYGNDVHAWSPIAVPPAVVAPSTSDDVMPGGGRTDTAGRDGTETDLIVYCLPADLVVDTDRFEIPGHPGHYEIVGQVQRWASPWTGRRPGDVARVRQVEG